MQIRAPHRLVRKEASGGPAGLAPPPVLPLAAGAARRGIAGPSADTTWLLAEPTSERDIGLDVSEQLLVDAVNEGHALCFLSGEYLRAELARTANPRLGPLTARIVGRILPVA